MVCLRKFGCGMKLVSNTVMNFLRVMLSFFFSVLVLNFWWLVWWMYLILNFLVCYCVMHSEVIRVVLFVELFSIWIFSLFLG